MPSRFASVALALLLGAPVLAQRAEIVWDDFGVPHVYAEDTEALFHAFGWAQMEAHADVLLRLYGLGSGRAAEHWGAAFLDADRRYHAVGTPATVRATLDAVTPEFRRYLDAFAEGINAFAEAHPERIADSLRVVLPVSAQSVAERMASALLVFAGAPGAAEQWARRRAAASNGSNAWAVTGPKSASGRAMLLANPHLPFTDGFRWFEAHLVGPDVAVYGATFVGIPVLAIAFTERHGWTHTVNTQDAEDVYELTLAEGGYRFDGAVRAFEADTVLLRVRRPEGGFDEEPLVAKRSVHGPVIATSGDRALARRAAPAYGVLEQWWDMARAASFAGFEEALRRQQIVGFTTTYADREGNILHYYGDASPVRPVAERAFWAGVVPGDTSATLWHEVHAYDELPRVVNPPSGWVQNANEASFWATWPLAFDLDAFPDYLGPRTISLRAQHSIALLDTPEPLTFEAFTELRRSSRLLAADRLLPDLLAAAAASDSELVRQAAEVLAAWDRTAEADSRGGVLFQAWIAAMQQRGPLFARPWSRDDPRGTPSGLADPAAAVAVLEAAAQQVEAQAGALDVPWGAVNRLRLLDAEVPASGGPDALGAFHVFHFRPDQDGRRVAFHGDTYVLAVEFGEAPRAEAVLVYGNATQAGSPHRTDQLELAGRGDLRPVHFTREEVERHARSRTTVLD